MKLNLTNINPNNIFFSSDFHFSHKNICHGTSAWDKKDINCRNFNTIEEMNFAIINSINSIVGKDDYLIHLGDWSFGGWENIWELRKQIVCENVIQINGNHDFPHIANDRFFPHLRKENEKIYEIGDKKDYRTFGINKHKNDVTANDFFIEMYDGTTNEGIETEIDGQKIILNHYPLYKWEDMERGAWMIHGHEHGKNKDNEIGKVLDIGWCRFLKPLSYNEIKEIMDGREIKNFYIKKTH